MAHYLLHAQIAALIFYHGTAPGIRVAKMMRDDRNAVPVVASVSRRFLYHGDK
ncbi:hypothetical protein [Undibacterium sp. WLHG33]|uniref:hypothetical protein n=1 Tax=Undibacterium sp. WLHG33 TaxID=3412482 RepID=UPI003C2D6A0D